jgi:hypothetical protein
MYLKSVQEVKEDDIHGEDRCIEDIESGFDAGGILKLTRPIATSTINPYSTSDASRSPLPHAAVPNLCAICLESYEQGQVVVWSSVCTHAFHQDCIAQYLAKKMICGESPCPSCRQKFCDLPEEPSPEEPSLTSTSIVVVAVVVVVVVAVVVSFLTGNNGRTPESREACQPSASA